jgi:putative adhesin
LTYEVNIMTLTRGLVGSVVCAAAILVCSACDQIQGTFDRTLNVNGPVDLDIRTGAGGVRIDTGPTDTVHVVGRIRVNPWRIIDARRRVQQIEQAPPVQQAGNTIRVGRSTDDELYRFVSISYDLIVPDATRVHAVVGSGGQIIQHVQGPVDATTGSGGVQVVEVSGDVRVTSGSGGVRIENAPGRVQARTGSGGIEITGARSFVDARAGSGGVRIEGRPLDTWNLRTGSGGINVRVADDTPFEVDARTASGAITSQQPVTVVGERSRNRLQGTVRGGGARVELETGSGGIHIE